MRFDLVDLRLFLHIADARSITRGADRANLALASASARIRVLERKLGIELLTRGRRGVSLTPAGDRLLDHARLVLQTAERLQSELSEYARGIRGNVHLLSNTAAFSEHLPQTLAAFLAANPTINVELEERESADITRAIASGAADIGIAADAAASDAVESYPFRTDRLMLVAPCGDALARRRQVRFAEIIDLDFVGLSRDSALQRHLAAHAARLGATLKLRVRVSGFDAVCRMVSARVGLGIVPETAARRCARSMEIALALLADEWATRKLAIFVRRLRKLPAPAHRLVEHLRRDGVARR